MEKIVIFGKGGSGKTTISSNLSTILSMAGRRVLHVGCDPKRDSLLCLVNELGSFSSLEHIVAKTEVTKPDDIVVKGRIGMDCVDSGGLEPGLGCGGRGIMLIIETLKKIGMLRSGAYDAVVFDVIGDLVCGGFTAVLKKGVGEKVLVVVSDDFMSLYAANNICKAIRTFWSNGIYLIGFVANMTGARGDVTVIRRFARSLSTSVLSVIPHSKLISEAEYNRVTVVEYRPKSGAAAVFRKLEKKVMSMSRAAVTKPTPMEDAEFMEFCRQAYKRGGGKKRAGRGKRK